jgi:2-polyprenyl-3-methyl-5-hydroxy-6-metoxy-1,4-benzoquinol methylase
MINEKCIVCGSQTSKGVILHDKIKANQCSECGLVWASHIKGSKELYESAYNTDHESFTWNGFLNTNKMLKQGKSVCLHWYESYFLKNYPPFEDRRLLEVGCSTGRFLNVCKKAGWKIYGLDISEKAVQLASELFPEADIQCRILEAATWPENYFDMLVAWEVIEHVDNPFDFVAKSQKLLKKDGVLALSTPDWGSWAIRRHPRENYWPPYHIWFFNKKNLSILLERAGFEVIAVKRNKIPWSETCWPKWKRYLAMPFLIWKGLILRQGGGRLVIVARKI